MVQKAVRKEAGVERVATEESVADLERAAESVGTVGLERVAVQTVGRAVKAAVATEGAHWETEEEASTLHK